MGNSSSHDALDEEDAWAFATAWSKKLHALSDVITVRTDVSRSKKVKPIKQITFVFPVDCSTLRKKTVGVVRDALLAWFALSCCSGFGVDENPRFWCRVLTSFADSNANSAISNYKSCEHDSSPSNCQFPTAYIESKYSVDFSVLKVLLDVSLMSRKLKSLLHKIKPFMNGDLWACEIPVIVRPASYDTLYKLPTLQPSRQSTSAFLEVRSLILHPNVGLYDEVVPTYEACPSLHISLSECATTNLSIKSAPIVDRALGGESSTTNCLCIERIHLQSDFPIWGSALPRLPSTSTIVIANVTDPNRSLSTVSAAWLGYALFSPLRVAKGSAFSNLVIKIELLDPTTMDSIESMAKGNNLMIALGLANNATAGYHLAKLRAGTNIFETRDSCRDNSAGTLRRLAHEEWVPLLMNTNHSSTEDEWVRVIVAGRGIGWTSRDSIIESASVPAAESPLRRMRVQMADGMIDDEAFSLLIRLLSAVGRRLTYLDILSCDLFSATQVHDILRKCPGLKSLCIGHDGSYWSDLPAAEAALPSLSELELRIRRRLHSTQNEVMRPRALTRVDLQPLRSPLLNNLRSLRVTAAEGFSNHPCSKRFFAETLRQIPRLQYARWVVREPSLLAPVTFASTPGVSHEFDDVSRFALAPLSLTSRLAFLSCVRSPIGHSTSSRIGEIDDDVVRHIFDFSSEPVPRLVCVQNFDFTPRRMICRLR